MTTPLVSICLPNLNCRQFLAERMESIIKQSLTDWELLVCDSYSDDGSWEFFQTFGGERRITLNQVPREGIYAAINRAISQAQGEYVYIATSDDTMEPECLMKMVKAMEKYPNCDICHCCLRVIGPHGEEFENWWSNLPPQRFYGELVSTPHIRKAPLDGFLHTCLNTVYHSLTQLLIRRSVFQKNGMFQTHWGPRSDFEWEMRASLVFDVIHLPEYLASWRVHPSQATASKMSLEVYRDMHDMVSAALGHYNEHKGGALSKRDIKFLLEFYRRKCEALTPISQLGYAQFTRTLINRLLEKYDRNRFRLLSISGSGNDLPSVRHAKHVLKKFNLTTESFILPLQPM